MTAQQQATVDTVQQTGVEGEALSMGRVEYSFNFPADMCGMLIGRKGANIKDLKDRSGCEITVKNKLYTQDLKLICLEGETMHEVTNIKQL